MQPLYDSEMLKKCYLSGEASLIFLHLCSCLLYVGYLKVRNVYSAYSLCINQRELLGLLINILSSIWGLHSDSVTLVSTTYA